VLDEEGFAELELGTSTAAEELLGGTTISLDEESSSELELGKAGEELLGKTAEESMLVTMFLISSRVGTLAEGSNLNMLALTKSIFKLSNPFATSVLVAGFNFPLSLISLLIALSKALTSSLIPCNKMETANSRESLLLLPKRDMSSLFLPTLSLMPRALKTSFWACFLCLFKLCFIFR